MPPSKAMPYGTEVIYGLLISEYGPAAFYTIAAVAAVIPIVVVLMYDAGHLPHGLLLSVVVTVIAVVICVILGMGVIGLQILTAVALLAMCRAFLNFLSG